MSTPKSDKPINTFEADPALSNTAVGRRLREWRKRQGVSQTQIGQVIRSPQSSVSAIEQGRQSLSVEQLSRISAAYGRVAIVSLLGEQVECDQGVARESETSYDRGIDEVAIRRVLAVAARALLEALGEG